MKHIIQFQISKGDTYYVAQGIDLAIVTQAKTLDDLAKNILEATALHLEDENPADFGLFPSPSVLINFELPQVQHA
jgi:predicted RNase H-like HicB family nuclease